MLWQREFQEHAGPKYGPYSEQATNLLYCMCVDSLAGVTYLFYTQC